MDVVPVVKMLGTYRNDFYEKNFYAISTKEKQRTQIIITELIHELQMQLLKQVSVTFV